MNLQIQDCEIWRIDTTETSVYRIVQNIKYFDILNRLGVTHKCEGRTDGQTDTNFILRQHNKSLPESIRNSVPYQAFSVVFIDFVTLKFMLVQSVAPLIYIFIFIHHDGSISK